MEELNGSQPAAIRKRLPSFLSFVVEKAKSVLHAEEVWLFGSRARGDAGERSDYDLAFSFPAEMAPKWPEFANWARDNARTLCSLDLIRMDSASESLKQQILTEGILVSHVDE